jgi:hypothetical protein
MIRGKVSGVRFRCLVISDRFPHWLLALRPLDWSSVYWMTLGSPDPSLDLVVESFRHRLKGLLHPVTFDAQHFALLSSRVDLILISGCNSTMQLALPLVNRTPTLLLPGDPSTRLDPLLMASFGASFSKIKHSMVGGVTNGSVLMGFLRSSLAGLKSPLRRHLKHVLDFGTRPQSCVRDPDFEHYLATATLRLTNLTLPVVYKSPHFCRTGWGFRSLSLKELACSFDLPSPAHSSVDCCALLQHLFPLKLLEVPLQYVLSSLQGKLVIPSAPTSLLASVRVPSAALVSCSIGQTWLPSLKMFLPDSWSDESLISDKAAKSDEAAVPVHLWDRRITLLFPHLDAAALAGFRRLGLLWQRKYMLNQFRSYLASKFGPNWLARLLRVRAFAKSLVVAAIKAKHLRGEGPPPRKRIKGGLTFSPALSPPTKTELLLHLDGEAGCQVLHRFLGGQWWDWKAGSSLAFWRWNGDEQINDARDGMRVYVKDTLPENRVPQRPPKPCDLLLMIEKLDKVLGRGYISAGWVSSLTSYFAVPKGEFDIRLVYDGTASGLNESLWSPSFWLPNSKSAVRLVSFYSFLFDSDIGECFLNFPNDPKIRPFCGVDLTPFQGRLLSRPKFTEGILWERWERCFMGCKPSPYIAVRYLYLGDEFCRGDRRSLTNPMRWDSVKLNLPGAPDFDPRLPRVMKWCAQAKRIAGDVICFMDDERGSGHCLENAWQVHRQYVSKQQYLGIQDAPRKTRPPSQEKCGAWAGTVIRISKERITRSVTQAKWEKGQKIIQWFRAQCDSGKGYAYKQVLSKKGFLVHLCMTYSFLTPFLKGFHLLSDSWRANRGVDGWKVQAKEWEPYLQQALLEGSLSEETYAEMIARSSGGDPPSLVYDSLVSRFQDDLAAMERLFAIATPPIISDRVTRFLTVIYAFTDASGLGFGDTFLIKGNIEYTIGIWGADEEAESSNYRELKNTVDAIERHALDGKLSESMIYFCTDNSTVENALYHGRSRESRLLHELVVRLKVLEAEHGFQLLVIHVSGKRMQAQGTDGVSRGQLSEGVMNGESMMSFVPLHETALERSPELKGWLKNFISPNLEFLSADAWFERGQDHFGSGRVHSDGHWRPVLRSGKFVWSPAPAAAWIALEELRKARIKRQNSTHIFVCPRLMTPEWLRQLNKVSDVVVTIPVGHPAWPSHMFEPLFVGLVFPFIRHQPWQLRGTPKMYAVERKLRQLWQEESFLDGSSVLRKFCEQCWGLDALSSSLVSRVLYLK